MKFKKTASWYILMTVCLAATVIRLIFSEHMMIFGICNAGADDFMMVNNANHLANLEWLGSYNNMTLVKGIAFPLILALGTKMHIRMTTMFVLLWTLSVVVFLQALWPVLKNKAVIGAVYVILIFNPFLTDELSGLRVYRNALTASQVLMMIGGMYGIYLRYHHGFKKILPWGIISAFGFTFFYFTREDSVWMYPFVIVVTVVLLVLIIRSKQTDRQKYLQIFLLAWPILLTFTVHTGMACIDKKLYGSFVVNEFTEGNFPKALQAIYTANTGDELQNCVTVTRDKLKKLYEYSPSLKELETELEPMMDEWDNTDRHPGDGEVEDGWFLWVIREAAAANGYHNNSAIAQEFYGKIAEELNTAMASGTLGKGVKMPAALMAPIHAGYLEKMPEKVAEALKNMITFNSCGIDYLESFLLDLTNDTFEQVTHNKLYSTSRQSAEEIADYTKYADGLNIICNVYQKLCIPYAIFGGFSFAALILLTIVKKSWDNKKNGSKLLMITGLALSLLVFAIMMAYNDIASCTTIVFGYLFPGYALMSVLLTLPIAFLLDEMLQKKAVRS